MKIKIILRFHHILVRIAIIKNTSDNKCQNGYEEMGNLYAMGRNAN